MKIVYITEVNLDIYSGVLNKLNQQIESWTQKGHEVHVVSLPAVVHQDHKEILLTVLAKTYFIYKNDLALKFLSKGVLNIANKILGGTTVKKHIDSINPDVIYLRQMIAFPTINKLFGKYPVVLESNTLLENELKLGSLKAQFFYKIFQGNLHKRINGFVGVTQEIMLTYTKYNKPCISIPNSVAIHKNEIHQAPLNDFPKIIFVGSPGYEWHGIDKFVEMVELFPTYLFYLVGPTLPNINLPNLKQLGYLGKDQLAKLYEDIDIAVGTLALYRKGMEEACPLKVREYLSFGIPVILSYTDTDISDQNFILKLENNDNCIKNNHETIHNFIEKWKGQRINMNKIHPLISTEIKEERRLNFIKSIIELK